MENIIQPGNLYSPSTTCYDLIKHFESCFLRAYQGKADRPGVITIGWGTIRYPDGRKVKLGDKIMRRQADEYLRWEVDLKAAAVRGLTRGVTLKQHQFDALVSFAYNLGVGALEGSTLLRKLRANPMDKTIYEFKTDPKTGWGVPLSCEFLRWINSNGKRQPGLVRRRTSEAWLYKTGEIKFFVGA